VTVTVSPTAGAQGLPWSSVRVTVTTMPEVLPASRLVELTVNELVPAVPVEQVPAS